MTNMTGSKLSIFSHPGKINGYWITRPFPYRGPRLRPGQYGGLFSRCRKYVINSLIHGHFHIGLVIGPRRKSPHAFAMCSIRTDLLKQENEKIDSL